MKKFNLILLLIFWFQCSKAQRLELKFNILDTITPELNKTLAPSTHATFDDIKIHLKEINSKLLNNGYLTTYIDSTIQNDSIVIAKIFIGRQYLFSTITPGNVEATILKKSGFKFDDFWNKPISPTIISGNITKILNHYENNGYPFAQVKLDSITINQDTISAALLIKKNQLIRYDSIIVKGNSNLSKTYLFNYLNITEGDPYNESVNRQLTKKLEEIPFIKSSTEPQFLFFQNLTKLYLHLDEKKSSTFNGIVGFLPNSSTNEITISGDIDLQLINELNRGERIKLNWRKLQNNVSDLKANLSYPFILKTPFGLDGEFFLYRRDTLYQDINGKVNIQYLLPGANNIGLFYENRSSRIISTAGFENKTTLPNILDISKNIYGLSLSKSKLDYKINPRKGHSVDISAGLGTRKIIKNTAINPELYDDLDLVTNQYNYSIHVETFMPISKRGAINIGIKSGRIGAPKILLNEQYRIGGLKTLRGFDEESIFASTYAILTTEYKFVLEQNSFAHVFIDACYYENRNINNFSNDFPIGGGLGINFETKAGIFSIDYALGYQEKQLAPIRSAKIHFGFINYF